MTDFTLNPSPPIIGQPIEIGAATLANPQPKTILSITPFHAQSTAVNKALRSAIQLELPETGMVNANDSLRVMWAGQAQWFVIGTVHAADLNKSLTGKAAITDQTDGWTVFTLSGLDAAEVMSRLTPLDLSSLNDGQTARAEFAHMLASISSLPNGFEVMVMRSFAQTAKHHFCEAMTKLAAQRALTS